MANSNPRNSGQGTGQSARPEPSLGRALSMASMLVLCAGAHAVPINGLFPTGVDDAGNPLADGASDPHFSILETNASVVTSAVVIDASAIPSVWVNPSNGRWVWETATGQPTNVTRTFRLTFDLTGLDPDTALIQGEWAVDNRGSIQLNGTEVSGTALSGSLNFESLIDFTVDSGFEAGINTLDFVATDVGTIAGFLVDSISGTADELVDDGDDDGTPVPEPGSLALLGLGLGMAGLARRRRRAAEPR